MKFAISLTNPYLAGAIIDLLYDNSYITTDNNDGDGNLAYLLVNTGKQTFKDSSTADGCATYSLETGFSTVSNLIVHGNVNGAQAPVSADLFAAIAFLPTPAAVVPVDSAGNALSIGDTVLVIAPAGKTPTFSLRPNGVAVITRITAKGALGFDFDFSNEFLSKRFQKVTLEQLASWSADNDDIASGDLVIARPGKHSRNPENGVKFALPQHTALTFRGVTVDKGNFILDGYPGHQYSASRFSVVTRVGSN